MEVKPWGNSRVGFIGASDAPTICGVNKSKSRFRLWMEKRGELEPDPPNEAMEMGSAAEDSIATMYYKRTGRRFATVQEHRTHERLPWMRATIDGIDNANNLVEFKLAGSWMTHQLPEDGDSSRLPEAWLIQLHHQMFVAERNKAFLAAWCADPSFRLYEVQADYDLMDSMVRLEEEFWAMVQNGTPPAEFGPDDIQAITRHFNREEPGIELPHVCGAVARGYKTCCERIKALEDERDSFKAELLLKMGNAATAIAGPYTLKRKVVQVKERTQTIEASSYVRFSVSNGEVDDE